MIRNLLASSPDAIHPVTREITIAGARLSAADTFAALYRLQALRRIAERAFAEYRRAGAADGADRLFDGAGARQSDRAQLQARHLHQFRQPARPLRPRAAVGDPARRHSVRHHTAGAGRPGRAARQHRPRVSGRHETDARRQGRGAAAACGSLREPERRRNRDRRGRRASFRHGAQRRIEDARRTVARGNRRPRRTTGSMR